jgi:hypothetical protein
LPQRRALPSSPSEARHARMMAIRRGIASILVFSNKDVPVAGLATHRCHRFAGRCRSKI